MRTPLAALGDAVSVFQIAVYIDLAELSNKYHFFKLCFRLNRAENGNGRSSSEEQL
jgi:hypothetical protein